MDLMANHKKTFKTEKPIIGCVHLPPLPGSPHYQAGSSFKEYVKRAQREIKALQAAGFDAVAFTNEGDRPYLGKVGMETVAAYTRVAAEALDAITVPYGCSVLVDPYAALAIAKAIGAKFIRGYINGVFADMLGFSEYRPGEIMRYRKNIDAEDVNVYCYVDAHGGTALDTRTPIAVAQTAFSVFGPAGVLVAGQQAGLAPDFGIVVEMKKAFPDKPILFASGISAETVKKALKISDGMVVGTYLKKDGIIWNEVDPERAKRFIAAARD